MTPPSQRALNAAAVVFEVAVWADDGDELWSHTSTYALDHDSAVADATALLVSSRKDATENRGHPPREVTLTAYITRGRMVDLAADEDDDLRPDWTFEATPFTENETITEPDA